MNLPKVNPVAAKKAQLNAEIKQTMHRPLPETPSGEDFPRNMDVVRLAIDLARLRGTTEPLCYLAEAAKLITDAGIALANEKERPELEVMGEVGTLLGELAGCDRVPANLILQPGKRENGEGCPALRHKILSEDGAFYWTPFRTEKGFRELLTKHFSNICAKAAKEMRPMLCQGDPKTADAENFLRARALFLDDLILERLRLVTDGHDGTSFLAFWQSRAVSKTVDAVVERTKAGWLGSGTLKALAETRMDGHVARAKKATGARKAKVNMGRRNR